jgi:hypothetical protein
MFVIEDELHAEQIGQFSDQPEAIAELRRLADTRWDQSPNLAPCMNWESCGRHYVLIEYDASTTAWTEIDRVPALNVSRDESTWLL